MKTVSDEFVNYKPVLYKRPINVLTKELLSGYIFVTEGSEPVFHSVSIQKIRDAGYLSDPDKYVFYYRKRASKSYIMLDTETLEDPSNDEMIYLFLNKVLKRTISIGK